MFAYQSLASHKYANAFQKPITNRQVPGYENIIYKYAEILYFVADFYNITDY